MIRATITSRNSRHWFALMEWCREQRIPLVVCKVNVCTAMEPYAGSTRGTRRECNRQKLVINVSDGLKSNEPDAEMTRGVLVRQSDYDLIAMFHGGTTRLSWRYYMDLSVGRS